MTPARQRSSATGLALHAVLMGTLLGHLCVVPFHAHAAAATTNRHGYDSDATDQAAHIRSREAVASSPNMQPLAIVTSTAEWAASLEAATGTAADHVAVPPPKSTPLFLLHASLLI